MRYLSKIALVVASSWLYTSAFAAIPNTDDPTTFLGPTLRLSTTNAVSNDMAYSLAGEAGLRNFRVGGTLGWNLDCNQRLKVSAEYLWQRINYAFFSGNDHHWVSQGALGAAYQYALGDFFTGGAFDLSAYVAHAPSKNLSTVTGTYVDSTGTTVPFTDARRIAGSTSAGASPGISFNAWDGGKLSLAANYDNVRYDTNGVNHDAKGWGGTIGLNQMLGDSVGIGLGAAFRKPFNDYSAKISWFNMPYYGTWSLGLFGDYNVGKRTLPNTYNIGLSADYSMECAAAAPAPRPMNMKGEAVHSNVISVANNNGLVAWTADPAVYMPRVLAVVDNHCGGVSAVTLVTPFTAVEGDTTDTVDLSGHFSGSNLVYSATATSPGDELTVSVSGSTLTYTDDGRGGTITVTASNGCSTATATIVVSVT